MALEITTEFTQDLPSTEMINKALETASRPEAIEYLADRFDKRAEAMRASKINPENVAKTKAFLDQKVRWARLSEANPDLYWGGVIPLSRFKTLQNNLSEQVAKTIPPNQNLIIGYAVGQDSALLRGYANQDGTSINEETKKYLDQLFIAYLTEKNMINEGGVVYQSDANGQKRMDENGNPIKVEPEKIQRTIDGFPSYLDHTIPEDKGIQLSAQHQAYPEAKRPATQKEPVAEVEEAPTQPQQEAPQEQTPTTPTTTERGG